MPVNVTIRPNCPDQRRVVLPREVVRQCQQTPVIQDLYVTKIGAYPTAQGIHIKRPRGVPEAVLIRCRRGSGWCRLDGRKWAVSEGQVLIIPPGIPHEYGANPTGAWAITYVHFTGRRVPAYLNLLGVSAEQPLMHLPDALELLQAFEELYGVIQMGYTEALLLAQSAELSRYLGLMKVYQQANHAKVRQTEEKILQSIAHMRDNLDKTLRLEELAAQVHMSVPHYCATFKRHANVPPILYHIRMRMQKACELLTNTDLNVTDVGQATGYEDLYYFSRVFKQIMGQTPSHYRKTSGVLVNESPDTGRINKPFSGLLAFFMSGTLEYGTHFLEQMV